jgi:hypothetical protein
MRVRLDGLAPVFREFRKFLLNEVALGLLNYRCEPVIQEDILFELHGYDGCVFDSVSCFELLPPYFFGDVPSSPQFRSPFLKKSKEPLLFINKTPVS